MPKGLFEPIAQYTKVHNSASDVFLALLWKHVAALWVAIKLYNLFGSETDHFRGLDGAGGPGDPSKRCRAKPPPFGRASRAPGAAPTSK